MFSSLSIDSLRGIHKWGKFVGYTTIILGSISTFFGLFAFIIGAIPGVITIILGVYLLNTSKKAANLVLNYEEQHMNEFLENFKKYLKLQGIFLIVYLAFMVLIILIYIFFFAVFISTASIP